VRDEIGEFCDDVSVTDPSSRDVLVIGESLVDLVMPENGAIEAVVGGGPLNTARALARLGGDVRLCSTVSTDRFGNEIMSALMADGVGTDLVERCVEPTTLAVAELSSVGSAEYRFYIDGTSAPMLTRSTLDTAPSWVFSGGLGLVLEPLATRVTEIIESLPAATNVMLDVNARPRVIDNPDRHRILVERLVERCSVVKVSDEDLAHLYPDVGVDVAIDHLLQCGARLVVVTAGSAPVRAVGEAGAFSVQVPETRVVDSIGAGDTFDAGMLSWWTSSDASDPLVPDQIVAALNRGVAAAAVVVGRRGADPPELADLAMGPRSVGD
jgi:fructokinase